MCNSDAVASVGPVGPILVYTDGACQRNGQPGAKAGVGVFFGENHPKNISVHLSGDRQTNQRAELTAALLAVVRSHRLLASKHIALTGACLNPFLS